MKTHTRSIRRAAPTPAPRLFVRAAARTPATEQLTLVLAFLANVTPIAVLAAAALR